MGNVSARARGIIQPTVDAQTDSGVHEDEKFPERPNLPGVPIFVLNILWCKDFPRGTPVFLSFLKVPAMSRFDNCVKIGESAIILSYYRCYNITLLH